MKVKLEFSVNLNEENFKHLDAKEIEKIIKEFQEEILIDRVRYDLDRVLSMASYKKYRNSIK